MATLTAHHALTTLPRRVLALLGLSVCLVLLASRAAAEPLDYYTGYTRPGNDEKGLDKAPPEGEPLPGELGLTIYYKVYRLPDLLRSDSVLTAGKDIEQAFVPGRDMGGRNISPKLDGKARYLYLYQVVNDSGRNGIARSVSVQLIVPPERITSWGHFALRRENDQARGLSFALEVPDKTRKSRTEIWPVSSEHTPVKPEQSAYQNPAPYEPRPDLTFDLQPILVNNIVAAGPETESVGREPDRVMLVTDPSFKPRRLVQPRATAELMNLPPQGGPLIPFSGVPEVAWRPPVLGPGGFLQVNPFEVRQVAENVEPSNLVFRAFFEDPLRPNQRSTVFGFTSDLPPIYVPARIRGTTRESLVATGADRGIVAARSDSLLACNVEPSNFVSRAFLEDALRRTQRSTGFGFASDLPPIHLPGRMRDTTRESLVAAGLEFALVDARSDSLVADGGVPSPVGPATPAEPVLPTVGNFGGVSSVAGPSGGGGGGFPGGGGTPGGGGGGFPGGGGGLSGSGSTSNGTPQQQQQSETATQQQQGTTPTQQQQQQGRTGRGLGVGLQERLIDEEIAAVDAFAQTSSHSVPGGGITINVLALAEQAQQQQQQQKQQQKQRQGQRQSHQHHQVVPEPAALVSALLGLPLFWLLRGRLRREQVSVPPPA